MTGARERHTGVKVPLAAGRWLARNYRGRGRTSICSLGAAPQLSAFSLVRGDSGADWLRLLLC